MNGSLSTSYAKKALVDYLKYKYNNNISSLNTAWGTNIASWTTLTNSYTGVIGDQGELLYQVADRNNFV